MAGNDDIPAGLEEINFKINETTDNVRFEYSFCGIRKEIDVST
jgi:hypothetical protein